MTFSLQQARCWVSDLFRPNPYIYWADFLITILTGYALAALVQSLPDSMNRPWSLPLRAICFVGSALLFYRAALFIHELIHLPKRQFTSFRIVWNLLCGIPFLIPSFVYETHLDHHRRRSFGTRHDGEYLPLARHGWGHIVLYLAGIPFLPFAAVVRFAILTPLSWLHPTVRRWVHAHASSLVIDPAYLRPSPTPTMLRTIRWQEFACFALCMVVLVGACVRGFQHPSLLVQAYATAVFVIGLNAVRTLGAHRWWNEGRELSFVEQLLDSVNVDSTTWIGELWGPLGLRYHGLHHLFPSLPYHNIPEAHRRLMQHLPADSAYRHTVERSLITALLKLLRRSWAAGNQRAEPRQSTQHAA